MSNRTTTKRTSPWLVIGLLAAAAVLCIASLLIASGSEFSGADDQAEEEISQVAPDYEPWFEPLFEPASGEIESGIFALQAAIGGLVVGYALGALRSRSRVRELENQYQHGQREVAAPTAHSATERAEA